MVAAFVGMSGPPPAPAPGEGTAEPAGVQPSTSAEVLGASAEVEPPPSAEVVAASAAVVVIGPPEVTAGATVAVAAEAASAAPESVPVGSVSVESVPVGSPPAAASSAPVQAAAVPEASSTPAAAEAEEPVSPSDAVPASGVSAAPEPEGPLVSGVPPTVPPPWVDRYFPYLADETEQGSISIGDTSYGYLVGARRVTESASLGILPRQRGRELLYGTDQLVQLLEDAGKKFHARTKTRFWIGNIGRRGGGDIQYSVSHNSGRDADVALAYTDVLGAAVDPPDLVLVDAVGVSRDKDHKFRFDAERTWQIVKALVQSDKAQIEFLFLARNLTERVLRHAREKQEPVELIERAAALLVQPGGAPHDDHIHVRVYCESRDVEGGCLNNGPVRPWVRLHYGARARRIEKAVAALASPEPEQRARGVERLVLLQAHDHKDAVAARIEDAEGRVRAAAARALGHWGDGDEAMLLARKVESERDPLARAAILSALSDLGGPAAAAVFVAELGRAGTIPWGRVAEAAYHPASPTPFLLVAEALSPLALLAPQLGLDTFGPDEPTLAMKLYVIDAAGYCDRAEPVEPLFALLGDTEPLVRARAAQSLSRLLNVPVDPDLQNPNASPEAVSKAILDLTRKAAPIQRSDRSGWIIEGFSKAGFEVKEITPEDAWEILRAFSGGEPYSYNAGRALERISARSGDAENGKKAPRPPLLEETVAECRYWLRWLESRRSKLHLPPTPNNMGNACR